MTSRSSLDDHNVHDLSLAPLGVLELLVERGDSFTDGVAILIQGMRTVGAQARLTVLEDDRVQGTDPSTVVLRVGQRTDVLIAVELQYREVGGAVGLFVLAVFVHVHAFGGAQGCDDCDVGFGGGVEHDRIFPD